ncbi:DUF4397 domain-containing protein [Microbacteriaceae bacterium VKM Ac-2855]|nr:DUF4397 domain-containing protein [Microbacteriaceae bacterium VKM Ac-2855]
MNLRTLARVGIVAAATAVFGLAAATPAAAAPAVANEGWVRVAHLSPDTKQVDVRLTALAGGGTVFELDGVGYGAVSDYWTLTPGTYVVSMVPAGAPATTAPVIQQSVDVVAGTPLTVAALGKNADLSTTVFTDDLTAPADGQARIRVIQASTTARTVDVSTTTGMAIASDATAGSATAYTSVPAGPWTLDLAAATATSSSAVDLASGSVASLFVLDDASGGLTVKSVVDSAGIGAVPIGGIQTGGGATAVHVNSAADAFAGVAGIGVAGIALIGSVAALIVVRRRTQRA